MVERLFSEFVFYFTDICFLLFDVSKSLSNLVEFLNYLDKIDAFGYFSNDMVPKMGYEISKGLDHLHLYG